MQTNGNATIQPVVLGRSRLGGDEPMEPDSNDSLAVSDRSSGHSGYSNDLLNDDAKSRTGRETIAMIVGRQPAQNHNTRRGIIAPHAPFDTTRKSIDLQYEKYDKDIA